MTRNYLLPESHNLPSDNNKSACSVDVLIPTCGFSFQLLPGVLQQHANTSAVKVSLQSEVGIQPQSSEINGCQQLTDLQPRSDF